MENEKTKDDIQKIIQESIKEAKITSSSNNYKMVSDSLENLTKLQEMSHKRNANRAVWISVVIAGIGLLFSIMLSFGGVRLTMQDFFNDVKHLKQTVKEINVKLDNFEKKNEQFEVYKYKIDRLQEDFDRYKDSEVNNVKR